MKSPLQMMLLQAIAAGLANDTQPPVRIAEDASLRPSRQNLKWKSYRGQKRTGPLAEQLKANAAAKRERRAKRMRADYSYCVRHNTCLKITGKNFITARNEPC